ncbi:WASH complex subunit 7-like protein [Diplonema papillatum]|nr:WASH complex subunit 7-like protein [Diplonema papillatum]
MNTDDAVYDTFRDQPDKLPQDVVYDKFRTFVRSYGQALEASEKDLDEGVGEVWDMVDPITLDFCPDNKMTLEEVMGSKAKADPLFYKVMLVSSSLAAEVGDLVDEANNRLLPALSTFGEQPENKDQEDGEVQLSFGRMLPLFLDLWTFCDRSYKVIENIVRQLASIYNDRNRKRPNRKGLAAYSSSHFTQLWVAMLELMTVLITFDQMITQNDAFHQALTIFKRMIKNARNQPEKYDTDATKAKKFGIFLDKLETDLLDDLIFQRCLDESPFECPEEGISVRDNLMFMHEFDFQMRELYTYIRSSHGEHNEIDRRGMYVGLCGLYVMYFSFFRDKIRGKAEDKKFFKTLFDVHRKVPVIHLYGNTTFSPAEWLGRRIPDMANAVSKDPMKDHAIACKAVLGEYEQDLETIVSKLFQDVIVWACRFESKALTSKTEDLISRRAFMITRGVHFAVEISTLVKTVLDLHVSIDAPLTVKKVILLCKCVELLKTVLTTFHRKSSEIGNLMSIMCEYISFSLQRVLVPFKRRLKENQAKLDETQIDQMSAIDLMQKVLVGAPTRNSLIILKNAMQIVTSKTGGLMKPDDFDRMRVYLRRLELLANWQPTLIDACNCSFLYWHRAIIPKYFEEVFRQPALAPNLVYMFSALHDPARILLSSGHLASRKALFQAYVKETEQELMDLLVHPLCREIENTLRLNIHSVVLGQGRHRLEANAAYRDYQHLLNIPSLRVFGKRINIRDFVQNHLERQFYNLTTLQPNDWQTYEEMRALAKEKYDMSLTDAHLPRQILDQGLDIIEITRSINIFVTKYAYNMNSQFFLERPSSTESKHLHSVHIRHVANSIKTHGTGMMNTTVNFVFRFLASKFHVFSQFLFDDHVKSPLLRDIKWMDDHRDEFKNLYPMKRAQKFLKDIRRLGVDNGQSYLDLFRRLITEIGNALGYVRMVRTGGMCAISGSINFVPSLEDIPSFAELLDESNFRKNPDDEDEEVEGDLPESTREAAANVDAVIQNQVKKFSEGSDYFKLLEGVFREKMNNKGNQHLQNFYAIIPALTLSFMEHMIANKDGLSKKGRECSFSDDGFALGVVFILKALNLNDKFESLHWFESARQHFREESAKIEQQVAANQAQEAAAAKESKKKKGEPVRSQEKEGELSTLNLSANRLKQRLREVLLLTFSFKSAKVFFKDKRIQKDEDEEEEEEEDDDDLDEA